METQSFHRQRRCKVSIKSLTSKDTRQTFSDTACFEHDSSNRKFQTFGKPHFFFSGADVGPRSASEKLTRMFSRSGEIPSPRQASIDKTCDCFMTRVLLLYRGSDPPQGHRVHTMGWLYVAGAGQAYGKNQLAATAVVCTKQMTIFPDPPRMAKHSFFFSGLGGERRTPPASSRPLGRGAT